MHVHLVAPSNEDSTYIKPLWAATLAAHTPPDHQLTFRDDGIEPIDLEREGDVPDLVGISVSSKTAARAYAIADAYRKRGSKVVLGGIHVTALPDEGLEHADAVVAGEAEGLWHEVVADAAAGKLGRGRSLLSRAVYRQARFPELKALPAPIAEVGMTIAEMLRQRGVDEGLDKGKRLGLDEGEKLGQLIEARKALRRVFARRGLVLEAALDEVVERCEDLATLERWHDHAVTAASVDDALR